MSIELLTQLNREWAAIARRPITSATLRRWQLPIEVRTLDQLVRACGYRPSPGWPGWHPSTATNVAHVTGGAGTATGCADGEATADSRSAGADEVLVRLVLLAHHDELAARVVLQRILPALVSRARRWRDRVEVGQHEVNEIVSSAWHVVRTFPSHRTGTQLAARLVFDAEYHAFIRPHRRLLQLVPTEAAHLDRAHPDHAAAIDELVALVRDAHLATEEQALLSELLRGDPLQDVADRMHVSIRTVTNRRTLLVQRLREVA